MKTFKSYLEESSLSRVFTFIEDEKRSFAVISAARGELSEKENKGRHTELKTKVRDMKLGFIELRGGYKEETGFVKEMSLLIPSIDKKKAIALGEAYDQHSILYKDGKKEFSMIGTNKNSGVGKILNKFKFGSGEKNITMAKELIKDFFSSLLKGTHRGKKFLFQMEELEPNCFNRAAYHKDVKREWITIIEEK